MPPKPTKNIAMPTGISKNNNTRKIAQPIIPIRTGLISIIKHLFQYRCQANTQAFFSIAFTRKFRLCAKNPHPVIITQKAPTNANGQTGRKVNS